MSTTKYERDELRRELHPNRDVVLRLLDERDEQERAIEHMLSELEAGTLHRMVCNANHSKPIGGDMCICNPLKPVLAAVKARAEKAEAEFRARLRRAEDLRFAAEADVERIRVAAAKAEHELHHLVFGMNQRGGGYEEALKALGAALAPPKLEGTIDGVWRCSCCGEMKPEGLGDTSWRWAGDKWQHKCESNDPQHGHEDARYFGPTEASPPERIVAAAVPSLEECQQHQDSMQALMAATFGLLSKEGGGE